MRSNGIVAGLVLVALALAGCTGQFDVEQTEPLRIQLEGGAERAELGEGKQREFVVVKPATTERVRVDVTATSTSTSNPTVIIIVRDRDTGQELDRDQVVVQNNTASTASLDVDVRGKDNVVVITQVTGGSAVVNVAAHEATATQTGAGGTTGTGGDTGGNMTAEGETTTGGTTTGSTTTGGTTTGTSGGTGGPSYP